MRTEIDKNALLHVHLNGASNLCSKRLPTPKVNKLQSPKLRLIHSLLVATITQNFMQFRCTVMEISSIPNYLVYSNLVYFIKRLPTPKVNKLQSPKLRLIQSLLVATFTQNFMQFRCTVMELVYSNYMYNNYIIIVHGFFGLKRISVKNDTSERAFKKCGCKVQGGG